MTKNNKRILTTIEQQQVANRIIKKILAGDVDDDIFEDVSFFLNKGGDINIGIGDDTLLFSTVIKKKPELAAQLIGWGANREDDFLEIAKNLELCVKVINICTSEVRNINNGLPSSYDLYHLEKAFDNFAKIAAKYKVVIEKRPEKYEDALNALREFAGSFVVETNSLIPDKKIFQPQAELALRQKQSSTDQGPSLRVRI